MHPMIRTPRVKLPATHTTGRSPARGLWLACLLAGLPLFWWPTRPMPPMPPMPLPVPPRPTPKPLPSMFDERDSLERIPVLRVTNGTGRGPDTLTLRDSKGTVLTRRIANTQTVVLQLSPQVSYEVRLHCFDGRFSDWSGKARFMPYKQYETTYVLNTGSPLYFGEPD